jgi:hypothetical protein
MSGATDADSAAALLLLAACPILHLDSDDEGQAAHTVSVSLQIFGRETIRCKCDAIHSGLKASKVTIYVSKDSPGHKERIFGSIDLDDRDDSSFAIISMEVDNKIKSPTTVRRPSVPDDLARVAGALRQTDGHYFIRDFQTRIQTSVQQELALNLDPANPDTLFCQWRGTDSDGCPLSLELKGRRQVVV